MPENTLTWAISVLKTTPNRWNELTSNLPAPLLTRPPKEEEWSALECLQHLVDAERLVFPARVEHILAGRDFPAFDPDSQGSKASSAKTPAALAEIFAQLRSQSLAVLERVNEADLGRTALHAELGLVTLNELLHEWAAHDLMHTVQAERALMQPFIQRSGPWQVYFEDHFVK
ncbi:MAG TPA: DinB family protein [Anaerolineales bacterium]|nr:DinB family protein [Anaerolineales bacterium]